MGKGAHRRIRAFFMTEKKLNNQGIALLMVIWILALLSVIVGEFCVTMRTQVQITRNMKETTEAYYIAVAGVNAAVEQIIRQMMIPGSVRSSETLDAGEEDDEAQEAWRVNTLIPSTAFGKGEYRVWIDNEGGKVNINLADKEILKAMLSGFPLEEDRKEMIADSIMDWRDKDNLHRLNGAEDDYYLFLPQPYECKDDYFDAKEELLLVRGVTSDIFYGGLDEMVTVVPREKEPRTGQKKNKKNKFDYNQLNINAIPPRLWASLPGMTQETLDQILEYRKTQNFQSPSDLAEIVGPEIYSRIARYLTLRQTPYFTIRSVGVLKDSPIAEGVEAVVCISNTLKNKYQVLQWKEGVPPMARQMAAPNIDDQGAAKG